MRRLIFLNMILCAGLAFGQNPANTSSAVIGDVQSRDAIVRGSVMVDNAGTSIMSGAQVTSGKSSAKIDLKRGGELQVCRDSSITITSASNGREMLIALNSGTLETHYTMPSTSDTIITPDFRLLLTGPGAFHFALGTSASGGLCVRSLEGNASSIIVNEQFGGGAHQVKPGEQINFHNGHVDDSSPDASACGCPPPDRGRTEQGVPGLGFPEQQSRSAEQAVAAGLPPPKGPELAIPASQTAKPGQTFTEIDAPFVYRAEDSPAPAPEVSRTKLPKWPITVATPDAGPPAKVVTKRWYQRFGSALASIFGDKRKTNPR